MKKILILLLFALTACQTLYAQERMYMFGFDMNDSLTTDYLIYKNQNPDSVDMFVHGSTFFDLDSAYLIQKIPQDSLLAVYGEPTHAEIGVWVLEDGSFVQVAILAENENSEYPLYRYSTVVVSNILRTKTIMAPDPPNNNQPIILRRD